MLRLRSLNEGLKPCHSSTVLPDLLFFLLLSKGAGSLRCCSVSRAHTCGAHIFSLISSADLGPSGYSCAHVLGVRFPLCSVALIESLIALTLRGLQFLCHARPDELAEQEREVGVGAY